MVIGILGGGQLARMLALAGYPLGLRFIVLDPSPDCCSSDVAEHLCGEYDDIVLLEQLAQYADIITYEFENIPTVAVEYLQQNNAIVFPPLNALAIAQDRLNEKTMFNDLGIKTAPFAAVDNLEQLRQAMATVGWPAVLKTRTQGYDGKGQAILRTPNDLADGWESIGRVPAIVEGFVKFDREISVIAARAKSGQTACYPVAENTHKDGILRLSIAQTDDPIQTLAERYITQLLNKLNYVGVLALELFQQGDELLVNECAPRVHNSGHWTSDGADVSQFENHLRAILDLPLGSTDIKNHAAMVNILGKYPNIRAVLENKDAHLHLYDKEERAGRKIGHINICSKHRDDFHETIRKVQTLTNS